jgi:hypothetical protein
MSLTSELSALTRPLDRRRTASDGLFRITYGLRNPDRGRGLGLDGVDDEQLIDQYAEAIERAAGIFLGWGWPEPRRDADGQVPVFVFRTERLGFGDCPLTFTGEVEPDVYASQIALRSALDEPRPEVRLGRARIEAAHETTHAFTHGHVSPLAEVGDLWAWFDEATAVFIEGHAYPDHPEALRFGLYWVCCPESSLLTWGGFGGYFAAWFLKYLVHNFGAGILLEVWSGSEGKLGPLEVLARQLEGRGQTFPDVFWSYCCAGSATDGIDSGLLASFGPRAVTETLAVPQAVAAEATVALLSSRYYRIAWGGAGGPSSALVTIQATGPLAAGELRAAIVRKGPDVPPGEPVRLEEVPGNPARLQLMVSRPGSGESLVLVVARVLPPAVQRPAPAHPLAVRVAVGDRPAWDNPRPGEAEAPPALEGFVDATDYTFQAEDGSRVTVLVTSGEDLLAGRGGGGATGPRDEIARKVQEYRNRLTALLGGPINFDVVEPAVRPGIRARGLSFNFQNGDQTWREWSAFLELADGPALQVSVVAPAERRDAADWFEKAVSYLRPSASADEPAVAARSTVPLGRARFDARTGAHPAPAGYAFRTVGPASLPIPLGFDGPGSFTLVSRDREVRLKVEPVHRADITTPVGVRARGIGPGDGASGAPEAVDRGAFEVSGVCVPGAEAKLERAKTMLRARLARS